VRVGARIDWIFQSVACCSANRALPTDQDEACCQLPLAIRTQKVAANAVAAKVRDKEFTQRLIRF
jgi:hypothetical protein